MGFMETICAGYLQIVNVTVFVLSIAVIVLSSILLSRVHTGNTYGLNSAYYWGVLAIGILLFLLSIVGCACVKKGNKMLIFTYGILQLAIGIVVVIGGVFMIYFARDYLLDIAETPAAKLTFNVQGGNGVLNLRINAANYLLGFNSGCCGTGINTYTPCGILPVGPCTTSTSQYNAGFYASGGSGTLSSVCSRVDSSITCADLNAWLLAFYNYAKPFLLPCGIGLTVVGSLLLLAFIGTIVVGCTHEGSSGSYGAGK